VTKGYGNESILGYLQATGKDPGSRTARLGPWALDIAR